MTLQYISGFFDADGSITMCKDSKSDTYKTIKIDFTNTYITILKEIQKNKSFDEQCVILAIVLDDFAKDKVMQMLGNTNVKFGQNK